MSLSHVKKTPQLLDILIEMNELVQALSKSDMTNIIKDLKAEAENLKKQQVSLEGAKLSNEMSLSSLERAKADADKAAQISLTEAASLELKKKELSEKIKLHGNLVAELDAAKKSHAEKLAEHDKKVVAVNTRELKANQLMLEAQSLKKTYEDKLEYIKKIPV